MANTKRRHRALSSALESLEQRVLFSAGLLDTTFNNSGKQTANYGGSTQDGISVAFQTDHKAIVVGDVQKVGADKDAFISRWNEDGTPDTSYGTNGVTMLNLGSDEIATDVAIQTDGKAVVCGITGNLSAQEGNFFVARYNTDGTLDTTFNASASGDSGSEAGVRVIDFGGLDGASGITITPSGRIIVVGASASIGAGGGVALAFLKPDGTFDTSVGGGQGHLVQPALNFSNIEGATDVVQGPNGKFFISGFSANILGGGSSFMVEEFNADGTYVSTFGNKGRAFATFADPSFSGNISLAMGIAYDPVHGKIAAAGAYANGLVDTPPGIDTSAVGSHASRADFAIAQFNATTGVLDSTFANGGNVTVDIPNNGKDLAAATDILYMPNGKVVAAGGAENGADNGNSDFASVRLNTDGSLDTTFGANASGIVLTDFNHNSDGAFGIRLQWWDNKVYEVGHTKSSGGSGIVALVRYTGDGALGNPLLSVGDASVIEGNSGTTTAQFTVTLSNPSSNTVTVNLATADGTAKTSDNDYSATSGTLTFNPGQTSQTISVTVFGDTKVEDDETFNVNLSSATNATILSGTGTGTIVNDDAGTGSNLSLGAPTAKIPAVIIGGAKNASGTATIVVTNNGSSSYKGTLNFAVYGATDTVFNKALDKALGTLKKSVSIKPGKSLSISVKIKFGSVDSDSDFHLIATATGPGFASESASAIASANTVHVVKPTISLAGSGTTGAPMTAASGAKITAKFPLTNHGNVPAIGSANFQVTLVQNGFAYYYFFDKPPSSGNILDSIKSSKISILPGKTGTITMKLGLPAASVIAPGTYMLTFVLKSTTTNPANSTNGTTVAQIPLTIT